jgi:hypothetical protein
VEEREGKVEKANIRRKESKLKSEREKKINK